MQKKLERKDIDEVLFKFLKSIYLFENREIELFNIRWIEVYLLQLIIRYPGICVSELSIELKVKKFVISRMLVKLEEEGLIRKESDLRDKRVVKVYITDAGSQKIKKIEEYNYETVMKNVNKISEENIYILFEVISQLDILLGLEKTPETY